MKKVLVLTLAMVFAFASLAFAEVKVGGELKSDIEYKQVDPETSDKNVTTYKGSTMDTTKVTVTASEEGVFDASVTLKATDVLTDYDGTEKTTTKGIKLDAYELHVYDDLFTAEAWGGEAEVAAYATPLEFVKAPADVDTIRFTSVAFGPELVADFSNDGDERNIRLFGKYDINGVTIGGATNYRDDDPAADVKRARDYAAYVTADLNGVTVSGELLYNSMRDDNNKKYGVKASTTVADFALTGKVVRDNNADKEDQSTLLYGEVAYDVDGLPYSFSIGVENKKYENDDKYTEVALSGDYEVVAEFLTINAGFTTAREKGNLGRYTVEDVTRWDGEDGDEFDGTDFTELKKYNKFELGAAINVTDKLAVEPSYTLQKFETVDDEITYTDLAVDVTYAITDATSVTYGLTKRINELDEGDIKRDGLFHTLGVSVKF